MDTYTITFTINGQVKRQPGFLSLIEVRRQCEWLRSIGATNIGFRRVAI